VNQGTGTKLQITKFLITKFLITELLITNFLIYKVLNVTTFLIQISKLRLIVKKQKYQKVERGIGKIIHHPTYY
jgi:hypothetical protein